MNRQDLNVSDAYNFYTKFILNHSRDKKRVYEEYGFTLQGGVPSKDWEVFAAILLRDRAKPGDGADLERHEVKSAIRGGSFEYQYHKKHGLDKLEEDKTVDHIFIERSRDYSDIRVWYVDKEALIPKFDQWKPELKANYEDDNKQRFRRSVPKGMVRQKGTLLMQVESGKLVPPASNQVPRP